MKKLAKSAMALLLSTFVLASCGGTGTETTTADGGTTAPTNPVTLKVAFNQSEAHPQYKALQEFSTKLETETNGSYKLEISPNALLGDQRATAELVQSDAIQMAVVGNPILEGYNSDFSVIGLPYVYDSAEHQKEVFTSGVLNDLFKSVEDKNITVVGSFTAGARSIYTDKPIESPADLKGYKIRVMQSDTMKKMLDLMGGVGTPMAQGEVYTAIQQGVLEGGENNEVTYVDLKHYEVAPYFSYTEHLMVPDLVIMSTSVYNGMTPENKEIFDRLMAEAINQEFELWSADVEAAKTTATAAGATFVEIPDTTAFQEAVKPLQEEAVNKSETAKALYDTIRGLVK